MGELSIFAKRLKLARTERGLRQNELAAKVNVSAQTISAYEKAEQNGKGKNPTLENALAIAKELDVSLDWLCGNDTPKNGNDAKASHTKTYGDVACFVNSLLELGIATLSFYEETQTVCVGGRYDEAEFDDIKVTCPAIKFKDDELRKFLLDLNKMRDLMTDKTIDYRLYSDWLNGKIDTMSKHFIGFVDVDGALDDGELPF